MHIQNLLILLLASITGLFLIFSFLFYIPSRQKKITEIIRDIENLLKVIPETERYAIIENIAFFRACRSLPGYIYWGVTRRKKIQPKRLLEIADLPLPKWEQELYNNLSIIERRNFPGLTKPLRNILIHEITHRGRRIILDLGCGSMEAERQTLHEIKRLKYNVNPIFIGVDSSPQAWDAIKSAFSEFSNFVHIKKIYNKEDINKNPAKPTVYFYCADGLEAARQLKGKYDLLFSSRFKHHLNQNDKKKINKIYKEVPLAIEYDDYRTKLGWILPLSTAWNRPILLNGAVFSQIRQPSKTTLLREKSNNKHPKIKMFNPPGAYARVFSNKLDWWGGDD